jgi:hypothetical protein
VERRGHLQAATTRSTSLHPRQDMRASEAFATHRGEGQATAVVSVLNPPSGSRAGGGRLGGHASEGPPWRSRAGEDRRQGGAQEGAAVVDVLLHRLADA